MFAFFPYRSLLLTCLLPVLCIALSIPRVHAQTGKPCKAQVRANRGKVLFFENLEINQTEGYLSNDTYFTRTGDSIHIQQNGATLTRFAIKNDRITGTRYQEFYPDGSLKRVDSLSTEAYGLWHPETYFHIAAAYVISTRTYYPNGIPQTTSYYRRRYGQDSLRKTWYPNGTLQQTVWYRNSGSDSATWEWNTEGILSSIQYDGHLLRFYPTGILQSSATDTLMNEMPITCHKTYYPAGMLRSVEYEWLGEPYLTWLYYSEEGVLTKRINHATPCTPWLPEIVMPEEPMRVYTYVDQSPEFAGGEYNLKKYINEKLANSACNSPLPLQNKYEVRFTVNTDGTGTFQSLEGENAEGIVPAIRQCIHNMPRWKPGKLAGRPVNVTFTLQLTLQDMPKNGKAAKP